MIKLWLILLIPNVVAFADFQWTETTYEDFKVTVSTDGYLYRSTVTPTGEVIIKPWVDWFHPDWLSRMPIRIYNPNTAVINDYQVLLTTDTANLIAQGKMRSDGADIRFTASDGVTLIPHWVESGLNTSATKIWVKIPELQPKTYTSIYMYHNNLSTSTSTSDGSAVFEFFEDWESGAIPFGWTTGSIPSGENFVVGTSSKYQGNYAVNSGNADFNRQTYLYRDVSLTTNSKLEFYWAVSCFSDDEDALEFYAGPPPSPPWITEIRGEVNWQKFSLDLSPGTNRIKWIYYEDAARASGLRRGWIDLITIRKTISPEPYPTDYEPVEEKRGDYYPKGIYLSNVFVLPTPNTLIKQTSWTYTTPSDTKLNVYIRSSNDEFLVTDLTPDWGSPVPNSTEVNLRGKYVQYKLELFSNTSATATPTLSDITINYLSPPSSTTLSAVAISSTQIKWSWTDITTPEAPVDSYRIYTATPGYKAFVEYPDTNGLITTLAAGTTEWIETNLLPNTFSSKFVVGINSAGGNSSNVASRYTKAIPPAVRAEYFYDDPTLVEATPNYVSISTGVWLQNKYLKMYSTHTPHAGQPQIPTGNFTSDVSSGTGTLEYYLIWWGTSSIHTWSGNEEKWGKGGRYGLFFSTHADFQGGIPTGNILTKKPEILLPATLNRDNWYFHVASCDGSNEISSSVVLGPFYFNGAPSPITELVAETSTKEEGAINLIWTAPFANSTFYNLTSGKYHIRYNTIVINTEEKFNASNPITLSTSSVIAGEKQSYTVTGLVPGELYCFAIKTEDDENNLSEFVTYSIGTAAKVAKISFVTSSQTYYVGFGGSEIKIEMQDSSNNPLKIAEPTNIYLYTTSPNGEFATIPPPNQNWGAPFVSLSKGQNSASFWYRDTQAGNPTLTCSETPDKGWADATQTQTVIPGPATKFRLVHDGAGILWTAESASLEAIDDYGNISDKYVGTVITSSTPSDFTITPSSYTFTTSDAGQKTVSLNQCFTAGPGYVKMQEKGDENYQEIFFINSDIGWTVGDKGTVKKTLNKGQVWISQIYGTTTVNGLYGIHFVSPDVGFVCGFNGRILKTVDGGMTWLEETSGTSDVLYDIFFVNSSTGFAVGANGTILKTSDAGTNWSNSNTGVVGTPEFRSVYFLNLSTGFVVGKNGSVYKTSDSGSSWTDISSSFPEFTGKDIFKVRFLDFDLQTGYIVGNSSYMYKTTDGGNSWITQMSNIAETLYDIDFRDGSLGIAVGQNGKIIRTSDGGTNWSTIPTSSNKDLHGVDFTDYCFAVGNEITILKSSDLGNTFSPYTMEGISLPMYWNGTVVVIATDTFTPPLTLKQAKADQPVYLMGMRTMYGGESQWTKLVVNKTGTAADNEISSVKLYRDNGNRRFLKTEDTYITAGSFSGGVAELNFSAQLISDATKYFFIVYDLSSTAVVGNTVGLDILANAFTLKAGGIPMARNNLPINVPPATITPASSTVLLSLTELTPTEAEQGTKDVPYFKITLRTDIGDSPWRGITIERKGVNTTDIDIKRVNIYRDIIDPTDPTVYIGSGVFSGGVAEIMFPQPPTITTTPRDFYITLDISPTSRFSTESEIASIGISFQATPHYFLLDEEGLNGISTAQEVFTSSNVKILPAFDTVTFAPIVTLVPEIYQSEAKAFLTMKVSIDDNDAAWTGLKVLQTGSALDTDISEISLYRDANNNETFEIANDTFVAKSTFSEKLADIIFDTPETINKKSPDYHVYFLVTKISKKAPIERTVSLKIYTTDHIKLGGTDLVSVANSPLQSDTAIIKDYPDIVVPIITDITPLDARVNETNLPMLMIGLTTYVDASLVSLILTHEGTSESNSINVVKIYKDYNSDGFFDSLNDLFLASSTFNGATKVTINFPEPPLITDSLQTLFVVYDLNPEATPNKTLGVGIDNTGLQYNLPNSSFQFGYFTTKKFPLLDKRTPDVPTAKLKIPNPIPLRLKSGNYRYFTNNPFEISFSWSSWALNGIKNIEYAISTSPTVEDSPTITQWYSTQNNEIKMSNLNLKHNTVYYLWLKVYSVDDFIRTNSLEILVDLTPPSSPSRPKHSLEKSSLSTAESSFLVLWDPVSDPESGVMSYELQERTDTSPIWQVLSDSIPPQQNEYIISNPDSSKFYYYRIRAKNFAGSVTEFSLPSLPAFISLPDELVSQLATYPNPFDSRYQKATITYLLREDTEVTIYIFDLIGNLVKKFSFYKGQDPGGIQGTNNLTWDGTDESGNKVAQGMYILLLEIKTSQKTERKTWKIGVIH